MRVGIAQINTTVGDFEGNVSKIRKALEKLCPRENDVVLFPELTVCGYPPMDLLDRASFIEKNIAAIRNIANSIKNSVVVIGFVEPNVSGPGKRLYNAAAICHQGRIQHVYRKVLLPTYDVFDEARYFEPGECSNVVEVQGMRLFITICEDIWNDKEDVSEKQYRVNPVEKIKEARPDIVVNISASPFSIGKQKKRLELVEKIAKKDGVFVAYTNLVGGNDGLIFDGSSFVVGPDGRVIGKARCFEEDIFWVDLTNANNANTDELSDTKQLIEALCLGIRDYCSKTGTKTVCIGLSGGIDSAVVATLAARSLGPDAVVAISMPHTYTSFESVRDARQLCENIGIKYLEIPITPMVEAYLNSLSSAIGGVQGLTEENLQARIRGAILMAYSNQTGALVLNTGNKSELAVGYCTLYGDMVGGLSVIGDLTKTRVYEVAKGLNNEAISKGRNPPIPEYTLTRPPSAELRPGQKDEDSLPPYTILDPIVTAYIEEGIDAAGIVSRGFSPDVVRDVLQRIAMNEFKRRQAPIALKVTQKAFGVGRRFPVVHKFRDEP